MIPVFYNVILLTGPLYHLDNHTACFCCRVDFVNRKVRCLSGERRFLYSIKLHNPVFILIADYNKSAYVLTDEFDHLLSDNVQNKTLRSLISGNLEIKFGSQNEWIYEYY